MLTIPAPQWKTTARGLLGTIENPGGQNEDLLEADLALTIASWLATSYKDIANDLVDLLTEAQTDVEKSRSEFKRFWQAVSNADQPPHQPHTPLL